MKYVNVWICLKIYYFSSMMIYFAVRELQSNQYLCSLIDEDEGRYLTLAVTSNIIVAGGHMLKVWIHEETRYVSAMLCQITCRTFLAHAFLLMPIHN